MTKAEKIPKDTNGMIGLMPVAIKEAAVVTDVISIALEAFRIV